MPRGTLKFQIAFWALKPTSTKRCRRGGFDIWFDIFLRRRLRHLVRHFLRNMFHQVFFLYTEVCDVIFIWSQVFRECSQAVVHKLFVVVVVTCELWVHFPRTFFFCRETPWDIWQKFTKFTLSLGLLHPPNPASFSGTYLQSNEILLNLSMKCWIIIECTMLKCPKTFWVRGQIASTIVPLIHTKNLLSWMGPP
jgi:hypothetical protein